MKLKILTFLFLFLCGIIEAQEIRLSEKSKMSLITYGQGNDLYAIFGHSAIRIQDPNHKIDYSFNYGTFDFNADFFYMKFIRGNLDYFLTINEFKRAVPYYIATNRFINEIELNLKEELE